MSAHVIALASLGQGLSGGDRIYIELSRRWSDRNSVTLHVWEEGQAMCNREQLIGRHLNFNVIKVGGLARLGFVFTYFYRIILGLKLGFTLALSNSQATVVYSASEFWMDSLPALILKLRFPSIIWAAAWFQTAPNPISGFFSGRHRLAALPYWLFQLPIKPLIANFANVVLVNNEGEKKHYPKLNATGHAITLLGAVDLHRINTYKKTHSAKNSLYTAVFQGRFHPQKGVVELIEIWNIVCKLLPNSKLALIGDGPLMNAVREKISDLNLQNQVKLFGYLSDGPQKYSLFSSSKIVVHPALYDSGGMAAAEAMAFGLPCVGFDLPSYHSYYPQGMLKVSIGDKQAFANAIYQLMTNSKVYTTFSSQAKDLIRGTWSWDHRADQIWTAIHS